MQTLKKFDTRISKKLSIKRGVIIQEIHHTKQMPLIMPYCAAQHGHHSNTGYVLHFMFDRIISSDKSYEITIEILVLKYFKGRLV